MRALTCLSALSLGVLLAGCGGETDIPIGDGAAGSAGATTSVGGSATAAGHAGTSSMAGGHAGSSSSAGGASLSAGGSTSAAGGATSQGGSAGKGGATSTGGTHSGGASTGAGGTAGSSTAAGGVSSAGSSTGGSTATTGGASSVGGSTSTTGGTSSTGGSVSATGGASSAAGGSTGGSGVGGETGTGGTTSAGGVAGAGGDTGSGGQTLTPTTCEEAHGYYGCCDGSTYYYFGSDTQVHSVDCAQQGGAMSACGWNGNSYGCVSPPAGQVSAFPESCGVVSNQTFCPSHCSSNADCAGQLSSPVCDVATGYCTDCVTDADCASNAQGPHCTSGVCTCTTAADCAASPSGGVCVPVADQGVSLCGDCTSDASCAGNPNGPLCQNTDFGEACSCNSDSDCAASKQGPHCHYTNTSAVGTCEPCGSSFDCTDPSAPACSSEGTCVEPPACSPSDSHAPNDGPSVATDITPQAGDSSTLTNLEVCDLTDVSEWFKFTVAADGEDDTITLTWATPGDQLGVVVFGSVEGFLGQAFDYTVYGNPMVARLTYLPAGTYYIEVLRTTSSAGGPSATPTAYSLAFTRKTGQLCTSGADCAAEYTTQYYRSQCQPGGSCQFLEAASLEAGEFCEEGSNCASGICSYQPLQADAQGSFCTTACGTDADCASGQVCDNVASPSSCVSPCKSDQDCGVDYAAPPPAGATWAYYACDPTGHCVPPS